jgi:IK cytokine
VEVQRRYLGGDGEHSILVKGLDHSLLEQNKARAALSTEDDDALEEAFMEATSINVPKKRTREELLRDLKEQRARNTEKGPKAADEEARLLEEAKQKGKFKPIGFKPVGLASEGKKKKEKRSVDDVERKNKKRKVEKLADKASSKDSSLMPPPPIPEAKPEVPEIEEPIDDDFNIFADAGEYEGIGDDDDDDDDVPRVARETKERDEPSSSTAPQRWIPSNETEPLRTKPSIPPPSDISTRSPPSSHKVVSEDEAENEQSMRLVPLSSSAVPSIKDFLAMDQAAGSYDKKKKRKNKKKAGTGDDDSDEGQKKKSVEAKVDRDYKRSIPIIFHFASGL